MSEDHEEYRRRALRCQEMGEKITNQKLRADWFRLAANWLEMIPIEVRSGQEEFDAIMQRDGTGQEDSTASH